MKLVGLTQVHFKQDRLSFGQTSGEVLCDLLILTIPEESKDVTIYNVDQILKVDPTSIFEQTFIDGGRIVAQKGEEYHYLDIEFVNGERLQAKGTLKTLER